MSVFSDSVTVIGVDAYATQMRASMESEALPIDYAGGVISDVSVLGDLSGADTTDANIELLDGQIASVYGFESDLTVLLIVESDDTTWAHAFLFTNLSAYTDGLALQTPAVELRA